MKHGRLQLLAVILLPVFNTSSALTFTELKDEVSAFFETTLLSSRGYLRRRLQTDAAVGDWRCLESPEVANFVTSNPADILMEYHRDEFLHGDVCRSVTTGQYFCPVSCAQTNAEPFCKRISAASDGDSTTMAPCRVTVGEVSHVRCTHSPEESITDAAKAKGILQKFGSTSSHGDVCRDMETDNFFCPAGCVHVADAPYCYSFDGSEDGSKPPCRVDPETQQPDGDPSSISGVGGGVGGVGEPQHAVTNRVGGAGDGAGLGEMDWGAEVVRLMKLQREGGTREDFRLVAELQPKIEDARIRMNQQEQQQRLQHSDTQPQPVALSPSARMSVKLGKLRAAQKASAQAEDFAKVSQFQGRVDRLKALPEPAWASEPDQDDLLASDPSESAASAAGAGGTPPQLSSLSLSSPPALSLLSSPTQSTSTLAMSSRQYKHKEGSTLKSDPCTMHTYFAPPSQGTQSPSEAQGNAGLLKRWRAAWESSGWKTRILDESDARAHNNYAELKAGFVALPTVNPKEYEMSCFLRHLAMAAVGGGWMTDYDVVPLSLPACARLSNGGSYTTHEGFVPALVSATAAEYLRVTWLFKNVAWKEHPATFSYETRPHVSDMLALQHLQTQGAIRTFPLLRCGVVEASDVFDGAGNIVCKTVCPAPPPPSQVSPSGAYGSASGGKPKDDWSWGPLGAHFSHATMDVLQRLAVKSSASASSAASWMPLDVAAGLVDLHSTNAQVSMHYVRGRMLEVAPAAYRAKCYPPQVTATTVTAAISPPQPPPPPPPLLRSSSAIAQPVSNLAASSPSAVAGGAGVASVSASASASAPGGGAGEVRHRGSDCVDEPAGFCGGGGACCQRGFVDADSDPGCGGGKIGCDLNHCCVRAV